MVCPQQGGHRGRTQPQALICRPRMWPRGYGDYLLILPPSESACARSRVKCSLLTLHGCLAVSCSLGSGPLVTVPEPALIQCYHLEPQLCAMRQMHVSTHSSSLTGTGVPARRCPVLPPLPPLPEPSFHLSARMSHVRTSLWACVKDSCPPTGCKKLHEGSGCPDVSTSSHADTTQDTRGHY